MTARQNVFRIRRTYNQWVANETLEDYALRFTAKRARRWSGTWVASTALGAISFLALEAIGGAITLQYGFVNAVAAILVVSMVILLTAIPISYYAARYGVDSDLLTRGAGFGYLGSTITSLVYASFTFLFFALEAVIMAMALDLLFGVPLTFGYLFSALVVIPLVTYGITMISRFQNWTQPIWILLQLTPFIFIIYLDASSVEDWTSFAGAAAESGGPEGLNLLLFGAAAAVMFALVAQIGEQVDFLRFVPEPVPGQRLRWWIAVMAGGPGWIVIGAIKMLLGSFLAVLALSHGVPFNEAADPTRMYMIAFGYVTHSPEIALAAAGIFVILCQVKINVTNAYAGSIAWSNFFSRLTHRHPRPGCLARVQRSHRAAGDGTGYLSRAGSDPGLLRHCGDRVGGRVGGRPGHQQAAGAFAAAYRVQAGASVRHQSRRRGIDAHRHRDRHAQLSGPVR